jgi:hypothetical protein
MTTEPNAPYTLILKTTQTEPGWSGGVVGLVASINGEAWIVDLSDKSKVIAKMSFTKFKGKDYDGGDFEMGRRLQQVYMLVGQQFGTLIKSKIK